MAAVTMVTITRHNGIGGVERERRAKSEERERERDDLGMLSAREKERASAVS